jgi:hypothetical protein
MVDRLTGEVAGFTERIQRGEARLAGLMVQDPPDPIREEVLVSQVTAWRDQLFTLKEQLHAAERHLVELRPQDPVARLQQLETSLADFFSAGLRDSGVRRSFNSWLRSQGLQWVVDDAGLGLRVKVGAEFKLLSSFSWSSPRLHALHALGLREGAQWLSGSLETEEAVLERRTPKLADGYVEANLQLLLKLRRLRPLNEW